MNKYQYGKSRAYKGWVIQDVYQERESGLKRTCWRGAKGGLLIIEDTLAELKKRIQEEEYQYEEEEP